MGLSYLMKEGIQVSLQMMVMMMMMSLSEISCGQVVSLTGLSLRMKRMMETMWKKRRTMRKRRRRKMEVCSVGFKHLKLESAVSAE